LIFFKNKNIILTIPVSFELQREFSKMSNYSSEELSVIAKAPMLVGVAVSMVDMGIVSTALEMAAMAKEISCAAAKYPNNSIIQSTFTEDVMKSGTVKVEKPDVTPEEVEMGALVSMATEAIDIALSTLNGKASAAEIQEYKTFIYVCGEAVAKAAGEGLFGSGSTKISDTEAAALTKVKATLGL
jgi:hypothetical protein